MSPDRGWYYVGDAYNEGNWDREVWGQYQPDNCEVVPRLVLLTPTFLILIIK